jgi:hypothetical protein
MYIKNILKNKNVRSTLAAVACVLFLSSSSVSAATISINSSSSTIAPGDTTTLYVTLNSEGVAINNSEATINFPPGLFEVISISKTGSIFSLWVEEPYFSNASGVITLNGGIPTPGFNGSQGPVVSILVRAKSVGQATFAFSSAAVRANDGLGTDVLNNKQSKVLIVAKKEEPVIVAPVVIPEPVVIPALQITSPTHANQDKWYADTDPLFRWSVPQGSDAIQTTIDATTDAVPHVIYIPTIKEKIAKDLKDGVWYFKARARKDGKWGPTTTYIARIDTAVPVKNQVSFLFNENKKTLDIVADIVDETSGLDYYEIYINNLPSIKIPSSGFVNGMHSIPFDTLGNNTVRLIAVDRAGNSIEVQGNFVVAITSAGQTDSKSPVAHSSDPAMLTIGSFSAPALYSFIILILVIALLTLGAFHFGRHYNKPRIKSKVRNVLGKGDNTKVLNLLKKRLEKHLEILQNTRHGRILSKEERDIKEAIEGDLDEVDRAIAEQKEK